MKFRFDERWIRKLAHLPETSMGAQHVDILLKDHRLIPDVVVFNATEANSPIDFDPNDILDVQVRSD
jgi:hypothetical protein